MDLTYTISFLSRRWLNTKYATIDSLKQCINYDPFHSRDIYAYQEKLMRNMLWYTIVINTLAMRFTGYINNCYHLKSINQCHSLFNISIFFNDFISLTCTANTRLMKNKYSPYTNYLQRRYVLREGFMIKTVGSFLDVFRMKMVKCHV